VVQRGATLVAGIQEAFILRLSGTGHGRGLLNFGTRISCAIAVSDPTVDAKIEKMPSTVGYSGTTQEPGC
jgi:hypothetical protein